MIITFVDPEQSLLWSQNIEYCHDALKVLGASAVSIIIITFVHREQPLLWSLNTEYSHNALPVLGASAVSFVACL